MNKLIHKIKRKLHKSEGFSLVELLFSMLILMLSTAVVIECFSLGVGNLIKETRASQAQLLCSALTSSVQSELAYASKITTEGSSGFKYFSNNLKMGAGCQIMVGSGTDEGQIIVVAGDGSSKYQLVSPASYKAAHRAGVSGDKYLGANMNITWDGSMFQVQLWVYDAVKGDSGIDSSLASSVFKVKPLASAV